MKQIHVIDASIPYDKYVPIDLSVSNPDLSLINLNDPEDFGQYIDMYITESNALVAYGGYNERRNLYRSSTIFNGDANPERDIHIGFDIWAAAGTVVLAAFDGIVHSFNNNTGIGNYGPTIILRHDRDDAVFYTLYGHLSLDSLERLRPGIAIKQGEPIATLGVAAVNGGYPPHLHFQIINDLENYDGDYPGVCDIGMLEHYLENCPDPNTILNIPR